MSVLGRASSIEISLLTLKPGLCIGKTVFRFRKQMGFSSEWEWVQNPTLSSWEGLLLALDFACYYSCHGADFFDSQTLGTRELLCEEKHNTIS